MANKKISIIVPVYNVEKYLERCVQSLINQTYPNIEIILVDDKSPDSSGKLCDELSKTDERIKVIHKENNEGLGFARNTGIENATGDYILFVDSDDYIDLKTCETAKGKLEESNADICCFLWTDVFKDTVINNYFIEKETVFEDEEIYNKFLPLCLAPDESGNEKEIGISADMVLYKASLFDNKALRFVSEREYVNEDMIFRIELCKNIRKAIVIPDNFYYYFHNSGTLSTSYKKTRFEESKKIFKKVNEIIECFGCKELYRRNIRYFMINTILCIKQEVEINKLNSIKALKAICSDECLNEALNNYPVEKMPAKQKLLFELIKKNKPFSVYCLTKIKLLTDKKSFN